MCIISNVVIVAGFTQPAALSKKKIAHFRTRLTVNVLHPLMVFNSRKLPQNIVHMIRYVRDCKCSRLQMLEIRNQFTEFMDTMKLVQINSPN